MASNTNRANSTNTVNTNPNHLFIDPALIVQAAFMSKKVTQSQVKKLEDEMQLVTKAVAMVQRINSLDYRAADIILPVEGQPGHYDYKALSDVAIPNFLQSFVMPKKVSLKPEWITVPDMLIRPSDVSDELMPTKDELKTLMVAAYSDRKLEAPVNDCGLIPVEGLRKSVDLLTVLTTGEVTLDGRLSWKASSADKFPSPVEINLGSNIPIELLNATVDNYMGEFWAWYKSTSYRELLKA